MNHLHSPLLGSLPTFSLRPAGASSRMRLALAGLIASAVLAGCGGSGDGQDLYATSPISSEKSVTLQWDPPVANEDGTALTDLAGYRVYYGLRSSNYEYVVEVRDPSATAAAIELPWSGTWYISARSYRSNGIESSLSEEVVYDHAVL